MDIYRVVEDYLGRGEKGVLATIVRRAGPTPQVPGAKMFISSDGKAFGTIGGGCVEAEIQEECCEVLRTEQPVVLQYDLGGRSVEDDGMICGGSLEILLEPVLERHRELYLQIGRFRRGGEKSLVITRFGSRQFSKTFCMLEGRCVGDPIDDAEWPMESLFYPRRPKVFQGRIIEPIQITPVVHIYGAGHISQFIARMAKEVDFTVVVFDDRQEFANRERFPEVDEIVAGGYENVLTHRGETDEIYAVIVTRGHRHDALVLEKILGVPHRYVGMIGSRRKVKIILDYLREKGFDPSLLDNVHAPIGLDIHAETPQEIALSIVAQLVQVRGQAQKPSRSGSLQDIRRLSRQDPLGIPRQHRQAPHGGQGDGTPARGDRRTRRPSS